MLWYIIKVGKSQLLKEKKWHILIDVLIKDGYKFLDNFSVSLPFESGLAWDHFDQ